MGLLIFYALISIVFSFLCSILEAVLLSVTPSYVTGQVQRKTRTGELLQSYKKDIDRPLSAILTLNTIAHTVGAILVGVQAGKVFGATHLKIGPVETSYETIVAGLMTLAILILSEIIPKTIGANNWKALSPFTVKTINILLFALYPLVWVSQLITRTFKKDKDKSVLSRADFQAMAVVGEVSGALQKEESLVIKNLLNFEKLTVRDIMTPRTVMFMVEDDVTCGEYAKMPRAKSFSRIPLYDNVRDHITGIALKNEILSTIIEKGDDVKVKELVRPVNFILDSLPLHDLFKDLTKEKQHMSIVTDEYGSVVGLVTMEDLFETLLGQEIIDESDRVVDMQELARKKYKDGEA